MEDYRIYNQYLYDQLTVGAEFFSDVIEELSVIKISLAAVG